MNDSLHPTEGIRLLLERASVSDDKSSAGYHACIYTPDARFDYAVQLTLDGEATLTPADARPSEDDEDSLDKLCRSIARAARRKREEKLPPWPPRVLRWRGPGRG